MSLDTFLGREKKQDLHVALYSSEVAILDRLCLRYECSRSAVLGALLRRDAEVDLDGRVPIATRPGKRARRH